MNVTITFKNRVESFYTRADGSAALSKDVLELTADGSATVLWSRLEFDRGGGAEEGAERPREEESGRRAQGPHASPCRDRRDPRAGNWPDL